MIVPLSLHASPLTLPGPLACYAGSPPYSGERGFLFADALQP